MVKPSLRGVYVPIVTPFSETDAIATDALEALGRRLLSDGVAGLVPLGTAGEGALLDQEERRLVIETCARVCSDQGAQLIVGTAPTTRGRRCKRSESYQGLPLWPACSVSCRTTCALRRRVSELTSRPSPKRARRRSSSTTFPSVPVSVRAYRPSSRSPNIRMLPASSTPSEPSMKTPSSYSRSRPQNSPSSVVTTRILPRSPC